MERRGFIKGLAGLVASAVTGVVLESDNATTTRYERINEWLRYLEKLPPDSSPEMQKREEIVAQARKTIHDRFGLDTRTMFNIARCETTVDTRDADIETYLRYASLEDLLNDGVILGGDSIVTRDFLHPEIHMWREKCDKTKDQVREQCKVTHKHIQEEVERTGVVSFDQYRQQWNFWFNYVTSTSKGDTQLRDRFFSTSLIDEYLDTDVYTAISVQELIPPVYHPWARLMIFRALCDAGFRPQHVPAVHDGTFSYGVVQMTDIAFRDVLENTKTPLKKAEKIFGLPSQFELATKLDIQMKLGVLFSFLLLKRTLRQRSGMTGELEEFLQKKEVDGERKEVRRFVSLVLAAAHHYPQPIIRMMRQMSQLLRFNPDMSMNKLITIFLKESSKYTAGYPFRIDELLDQLRTYRSEQIIIPIHQSKKGVPT